MFEWKITTTQIVPDPSEIVRLFKVESSMLMERNYQVLESTKDAKVKEYARGYDRALTDLRDRMVERLEELMANIDKQIDKQSK